MTLPCVFEELLLGADTHCSGIYLDVAGWTVVWDIRVQYLAYPLSGNEVRDLFGRPGVGVCLAR